MKKRDLENRTLSFSRNIIYACKSLPNNQISRSSISQIIRSATSVGANYREALNASSYKDFRNKIYICKKEIQETKYWLKILFTCFPSRKEQLNNIFIECHELCKIFQASINKINKKMKNKNTPPT